MRAEPIVNYIKKFSKVRVDRSKGAPAPHKPILLLSLLHLVETKEISGNCIFITPMLVATFKDIWGALVVTAKFTPNFSLPFYHLQSDGFWHLHTNPGREILLTSSHSIKSFAQLKEAVAFAFFEEDLFMLLQHTKNRELLKQTLLETYFPSSQMGYVYTKQNTFNTYSYQMLHEPVAVYQQQVAAADDEDIFVRNGVFKKLVFSIYRYTC